ncbi:MAG: DUF2207 domain-containing protein [Candidatus Nomurabacteria bacterium]|jgi:uncharacterized membrane protein YgcG|nr:DUF2207 domain-containing protein [Candidatus Nomurabacteria bacterium]
MVAYAVFGTASTAAASSVTPFSFTSFDATYNLSKNANNQSQLEISETLIAKFANSGNQNLGINRVIPARLKIGDGKSWSLGLQFLGASSSQGTYLSKHLDADALTIGLGEDTKSLHGEQTYKLTYLASDVIMPNQIITNKTQSGDEFHWMVNGDAWTQTFDQVSATVNIPQDLTSRLDGRVACWNNELENQCQIDKNPTVDGGVQYTFTGTTQTKAQKSLVFDIGFAPETFAIPATIFQSEDEARGITPPNPWVVASIILLICSPLVFIISRKMYIRSYNRKKVRALPVIPQFIAPEFATLSQCEVFWSDKNLVAPLLLDLAVNNYVAITANEKSNKPEALILQKPADAQIKDKTEREVLEKLFPSQQIGTKIMLKDLKKDEAFGKLIYNAQRSVYAAQFGETGLFQGKKVNIGKTFSTFGWVTLFLFVAPFLFELLPDILPGAIYGLLLLGLIIFIVFFSIISSIIKHTPHTSALLKSRKLTDMGAHLQRHLLGLKDFMTVSEADRIKMLQSPQGAEKFDTSVANSKIKLIKLYEKLLPFATIFGIEKKWGAILQIYYTEIEQTPDFLDGYIVGHNFGYLLGRLGTDTRALSSMEATRIARETMSRSSSWSSGGSSHSGFSGGGGSFGGGGGGGGGR